MTEKGNVFIIGSRAVGKTTVGKLIAQLLDYRFVDTDKLICREQEATVEEIVQQHGWDYFRSCERQSLEKLATSSRLVVSTGGGAILHRQFWESNASAVVWLRASEEILLQRIRADEDSSNRPSLTGKDVEEEMAEVIQQRWPLYQKSAQFIVDTGCYNPEQSARMVVDWLTQREG